MGDLLTSQELANQLNVSISTIYLWKKQGKIPPSTYIKPADGLVRYDYDAVVRALKRVTTERERKKKRNRKQERGNEAGRLV